MGVVFEAADSGELLAALQELTLDVLLIDHRLSGVNGVELVTAVNQLFFSLNEMPVRMVVTAPYFTPELDIAVIRSGASDFVAEESGPELLLSTIREVSFGAQESFYLALRDQFIGSGVKLNPSAGFSYTFEHLSDAEKEVVSGFVDGYTDSEIAKSLGSSMREVRDYFEAIKIRFGFATRAQMALAIFESGLFNEKS